MKAVFTTTRPSSKVITPEGDAIYFVGSRLETEDEKVIKYMREVMQVSGGCITELDKEDPEFLDPIERIKQAAIKDYVASQKAAQTPATTK